MNFEFVERKSAPTNEWLVTKSSYGLLLV